MSDMWLYNENWCEGHFCPQDCDNCWYADEMFKEEEEERNDEID